MIDFSRVKNNETSYYDQVHAFIRDVAQDLELLNEIESHRQNHRSISYDALDGFIEKAFQKKANMMQFEYDRVMSREVAYYNHVLRDDNSYKKGYERSLRNVYAHNHVDFNAFKNLFEVQKKMLAAVSSMKIGGPLLKRLNLEIYEMPEDSGSVLDLVNS